MMLRTFRVTLDLWSDLYIHHFNVAARSHEEAYNRVLEERKISEGKVKSAIIFAFKEEPKC